MISRDRLAIGRVVLSRLQGLRWRLLAMDVEQRRIAQTPSCTLRLAPRSKTPNSDP
jgi:hypothetical protein